VQKELVYAASTVASFSHIEEDAVFKNSGPSDPDTKEDASHRLSNHFLLSARSFDDSSDFTVVGFCVLFYLFVCHFR
jgi:hypothetical protein